jgi:hypothetical protein
MGYICPRLARGGERGTHHAGTAMTHRTDEPGGGAPMAVRYGTPMVTVPLSCRALVAGLASTVANGIPATGSLTS